MVVTVLVKRVAYLCLTYIHYVPFMRRLKYGTGVIHRLSKPSSFYNGLLQISSMNVCTC